MSRRFGNRCTEHLLQAADSNFLTIISTSSAPFLLILTPQIMEHLQYPIGRFKYDEAFAQQHIRSLIRDLKEFPTALQNRCKSMNHNDLLKVYRPDGWNVRQLIHHLGESHLNAYVRIKLALTEDNPTIKPYKESLWVNTAENATVPYTVSFQLLEAIHAKMTALLDSLSEADFDRTYYHPDYKKTYSLRELVSLYSWHGKHHIAHIDLALRS